MSERTFGYAGGAGWARADSRRGLRAVGAEPETGYEAAGATEGAELADGGPVDPVVALAALERAADLIARADLDRLDDRGLLEHTVAVDGQVNRLEAQRLRALDGSTSVGRSPRTRA